MKAQSKKFDQKMFIRIGAMVLVVLMLLGVVFSTVGSQTAHDHVEYTEEELAALQALLAETGEDHSGHGHSAEELNKLLTEAAEATDDDAAEATDDDAAATDDAAEATDDAAEATDDAEPADEAADKAAE